MTVTQHRHCRAAAAVFSVDIDELFTKQAVAAAQLKKHCDANSDSKIFRFPLFVLKVKKKNECFAFHAMQLHLSSSKQLDMINADFDLTKQLDG